MTKVIAFPHLRFKGAINGTPWVLNARGRLNPAPALVKAWDYMTPLSFESTLTVDPDEVRRQCGLADSAPVSVVVSFWASTTNLRQVGDVQPLQPHTSLRFTVDPSIVGGTLTLRRYLVLGDDAEPSVPLGPRNAGSILWEEPKEGCTRVLLEGEAARFPTQSLSFAAHGWPPASWLLDLSLEDLDASALLAQRLYINSDNPLMTRFAAGDDDDVCRLAASMLLEDVGAQLINAALDTEAFVEGWSSFRPGSIGESLELLIRNHFPGRDASSLQQSRSTNRGLFAASLQAALRAGREL